MAGRGFCVKIELDLHAVTCPGVWLCPNGKVALQLNMFNECIESRRITPIFPLLFHDRFTFKKVFTGVTTLADLQRSLEEEFLYTELIQWSKPDSRGVVLATFETNLVDLLYPAPCFKGLLAGVDVDLLMEPTKFFPGILAPKIEISTRTVIEEVIGICDSSATGAYVVNPKTLNSMNPPCFCRKPPSKGIIRQRKVCHSQGKYRSQMSRNCSQKQSSLEIERVYSPSAANRRSLSQSDKCYHEVRKTPKCSCPPSSPRKNVENHTGCEDFHVFDSCPVCSKYKCYFACNCEGKNGKYICKCKGNSPKVHSTQKNVRYSSLQNDHSSCSCRPTSAPSPREDPSTLLLKAKIKQLQKAKEKLSHICNNREDDSSNNESRRDNGDNNAKRNITSNMSYPLIRISDLCCSPDEANRDDTTLHRLFMSRYFEKLVHSSSTFELDRCCDHKRDRSNERQGFYKNLEKFYKRMYKQARMRAEEVEHT